MKISSAQKAIDEVMRLVEDYSALLELIGADNVTNASRKLNSQNARMAELERQVQVLCATLECDNWRNATQRAKKLMGAD